MYYILHTTFIVITVFILCIIHTYTTKNIHRLDSTRLDNRPMRTESNDRIFVINKKHYARGLSGATSHFYLREFTATNDSFILKTAKKIIMAFAYSVSVMQPTQSDFWEILIFSSFTYCTQPYSAFIDLLVACLLLLILLS